MTVHAMTFPVVQGLAGTNKLALFLHAPDLLGGWHFGSGTRFDQTAVTIDFDDSTDLAPT